MHVMRKMLAGALAFFGTGARAQTTNPIFVPGSSQKVCQLIGETDREFNMPTVSQTETNYGLSGNDLGYSFEHNGKLWFLFGDSKPTATFNAKPNGQTNPPRMPLDNDSIGAYQSPVVLNAQGKPAITLTDFEVPNAGIDAAGRMFVIFLTDSNRA